VPGGTGLFQVAFGPFPAIAKKQQAITQNARDGLLA
jgi:hypothetical protein